LACYTEDRIHKGASLTGDRIYKMGDRICKRLAMRG